MTQLLPKFEMKNTPVRSDLDKGADRMKCLTKKFASWCVKSGADPEMKITTVNIKHASCTLII